MITICIRIYLRWTASYYAGSAPNRWNVLWPGLNSTCLLLTNTNTGATSKLTISVIVLLLIWLNDGDGPTHLMLSGELRFQCKPEQIYRDYNDLHHHFPHANYYSSSSSCRSSLLGIGLSHKMPRQMILSLLLLPAYGCRKSVDWGAHHPRSIERDFFYFVKLLKVKETWVQKAKV